MTNRVSNWRLLEREIIAAAEVEGFKLKKNGDGDFMLVDANLYKFNISKLAQQLTDRGVMVQGAVKATP